MFCSAALGRGHDHLHHVEAKSSNLFKATEHIQFGARNENWVCLTPNSVVSCYTKLCQVIISTMIIISVLTLSSPWGNLAVFLKPALRRPAFLHSGLLLVPGLCRCRGCQVSVLGFPGLTILSPSPPAWNLGSPFCTHTQAHHAMSARSCCQGGVCTLSCLRGSLGPENGVSTHSFFCLRSQHLWKTCHEHPACLRGWGASLYQGHQSLGCPYHPVIGNHFCWVQLIHMTVFCI